MDALAGLAGFADLLDRLLSASLAGQALALALVARGGLTRLDWQLLSFSLTACLFRLLYTSPSPFASSTERQERCTHSTAEWGRK